MSNQAISQELKRVRDLKRALASEVELLRSDMENAKVHLRVSAGEGFRKELAEKMIKVSHPAYSKEYQGWYKVDPVEGQIYFSSKSSFPKYSEDISFRIVAIEELFDENSDYALEINWYDRIKDCAENFQKIIEEYYQESDGNFDKENFVAWVIQNSKYNSIIQEIEENEEEEAVSFALGEIKDEIVIEIN